MDYVITAVQGGGGQTNNANIFNGAVWALKWIFPTLPGETKDSVSVNNLMAGEGNWTRKKEVLEWRINMEAGMVALPDQKHLELLQLLAIADMQRWMGQMVLERLVGKLHSLHLAVPGAVAHLYHIQSALTQGGKDSSWLSADFRR